MKKKIENIKRIVFKMTDRNELDEALAKVNSNKLIVLSLEYKAPHSPI